LIYNKAPCESSVIGRRTSLFEIQSSPFSTTGGATPRTPMASRLSGKVDDSIVKEPELYSSWKVYPPWQYDVLVKNYGQQNVKRIYVVRHAEGWHNVNKEYKSRENLDARLTQLGKEQCYKLRDELLTFKKEHTDSDTESGRYKQSLEYLMNGSDQHSDDSDICVVVSPMTRCIQTALLAFDFWTPSISAQQQDDNSGKVPFFGLEAVRETVNYNCDRRRRITEVSDEFPRIDFSFCKDDEDEIWLGYRRRQQDQENLFPSKDDESQTDSSTATKKNYLESAELYVVANRGRQALEFLQSLPQSRVVVSTHSAYLRCILNWGQEGGVPRMFEQRLDEREDPTRQDKLFDYCYMDDDSSDVQKSEFERASFEEYMREDYENAEMRSFCLVVQ